MDGSRYAAVELEEGRFWIPHLELGLGIWEGEYQGSQQPWLRWYDTTGNWVLTPTQREAQRAEQERQKTERLIAQLRALGVEPDLD